ncbi:protein of unknown function [Methylocella tundrae]|uniref:Uncharacterized protein n=1 Tax=Methylocella tundrae TaxID=227605 RepID=A0A4U8Z5X5_METTU|nr:protein of unknown function [Methylocella tundrae]
MDLCPGILSSSRDEMRLLNLPPLSQSRPAAPAGFRRSSPRTAAVLSSPPPDRQIPASRRWTTAGKLLYKTPLVSGPPRDAQVAQLVEHATENRSVGGSIPPLGTSHPVTDYRRSLDKPSTWTLCVVLISCVRYAIIRPGIRQLSPAALLTPC